MTDFDSQEIDPMLPQSRIPVALSWKNIVYTITQKTGHFWNRQTKEKVLLNDVSGIVKPGQLLAIMGSTGAGKSTLLDVLVGYKNTGTLRGEILINGEPRNNFFKRMAGYVTQDDCQMDTLTVRETLQFYADLRLPASVSKAERESRVQTIIEELRLQKCAESYIGSQFQRGISGGERKRVSIGCELITDPGLLFLDEPTTGLDAYNSFAIMELLNTLTKNGRTIVCTIHQPRSAIFELFDQLMLLSQGQVVYFGAAKQAVQYFGALGVQCGEFTNPADFFIDMVIENERQRDGLVESVGEPLDLPNSYRNSSFFAESIEIINTANTRVESSEPLPELDSEYATDVWTQFVIIATRSLKHLRRNPVTAYVQFFQTCFMAALIGSIFFRLPLTQNGVQDRNGALFFILTNQSFAALASLNLFLQERNLFNRERASGTYRTIAYYLSKCAVEGVFQLIFPIAFSFVVYWLVGLQTRTFGVFLATLVLTSAVSSSLFINIGAISPTQQIATIMAPIIVVLFLLFGGFYLNIDSFPVYYRWFGYLSFFRYAFEILAKAEFEGLEFSGCLPNQTQCIHNGTQQLENLSMTDVNYTSCFMILLAMMIGYRILAYLSLAFLFKEKR